MDVSKSILLILFFALLTACGTSDRFSQTYHEPTSQCTDSAINNRYLVRDKTGNVIVESISRAQLEKKYDDIALEKIAAIEPDYQIRIYTDSGTEAVSDGNWGISAINVAGAWNAGYYGQNVLVAVIDSGIDLSHPALYKRLAQNIAEVNGVQGIDDDNNGFVDDTVSWNFGDNIPGVSDPLGHGTHVAGIIAAEQTGNINDSKGVAPQSTILPISFIDSTGSGYISNALRALDYAGSRNANVINASWGGGGCSTILQQKIEALKTQDVVFVAASGNSGVNIDHFYEYPAALNLPNQITVGSIDPNDGISYFSNYGFVAVHLLAPGASILSTYPGGNYKSMSGTSMATPFVTGAVAILKGARPHATYAEIKSALINSVTKRNYPVLSGGQLNISAALNWLQTH